MSGGDRHSLLPFEVTPRASATRDREFTAMPGLRPQCENCGHRHTIHARCSIHASNCAGCGNEPEAK